MADTEAVISIFVSYAHEDDEERKDLTTHLRQIPNVAVWDDRAIPAGSNWDEDITTRLNTADIILLLISKDFLDSEYVKDVEIKVALERNEAGDAIVIPILLKSCIWTPRLGGLQALPSDENLPEDKNWVTSDAWNRLDDAYTHVARGVMRQVDRLSEIRTERQRRRIEAEEMYRKEVAKMLADGIISDIERDTLDELREELELSQDDADRIEKGELRPLEERRKNLVRYEKTLRREVLKGYPFSAAVQTDLTKRRDDLLLTETDVVALHDTVVAEWASGETERAAAELAKEKEEADRLEAERLEADRPEADRVEAERVEAERIAGEEAKQKAREESEQAVGDAWDLALGSFLDKQLEDTDGLFRLGTKIPKAVLKKTVALYELPEAETVVGMFADFDDEPELFGVVFGRQALHFHNPAGSSPGAHSVDYSSLSSRTFDVTAESEVVVGDDLFFLTPIPAPMSLMFGWVGGLYSRYEAAVGERDGLLSPDEVEGFAGEIAAGWHAEVEAQEEAERAWADELTEFLGKASPSISLFVAPEISDRKASNAVARYEIPNDEGMLGLIDETVGGSAKNGLVFGLRGLYFHNAGGSNYTGAYAVPYESLAELKIEVTSKYEVALGDDVSYNTFNAGTVAELLQDLQKILAKRRS